MPAPKVGPCCLAHFRLHLNQWFLLKLARYESRLKRKISELDRVERGFL